MLQGSFELSAGDLRKEKKRHVESVYIQHKETERCFCTESTPGRRVKQCRHLVLIVVEVMLSAEISLLSFYSCFSVSHAPPTPRSSDKGNVIVFLQHKGILCSLWNCYLIILPNDSVTCTFLSQDVR